jgi:hypothetical protein
MIALLYRPDENPCTHSIKIYTAGRSRFSSSKINIFLEDQERETNRYSISEIGGPIIQSDLTIPMFVALLSTCVVSSQCILH